MRKFTAKKGEENSIKEGERRLGEGGVIKAHAFSLTELCSPSLVELFPGEKRKSFSFSLAGLSL